MRHLALAEIKNAPYPFLSATPPPKWLTFKRPFLAQFITTGNNAFFSS
jgi:hypothetical protein